MKLQRLKVEIKIWKQQALDNTVHNKKELEREILKYQIQQEDDETDDILYTQMLIKTKELELIEEKEEEEAWAQLLHAKFHTTSGERIQYHKRSSVWPGIKHADDITKPFIGWIIGKGTDIEFWRESWAYDIPLREHIDLPHDLWKKCTARVSDFKNAEGWNFPSDISLVFLAMGIDINNIPCNLSVEDIQIWKPDVHGDFSVKFTFECTRK
ncbi:hypothetical protein GIB67_011480 [Kingdonia uniflora]|uniref:Uncharacterized protein n=1 Tax=Kingdonia uniflora TaxID=39325 RepID=A0A7J7NLM9_9MAGN|nr:hypothetical protein GIB67_011480 [Kingdonia uniflora]